MFGTKLIISQGYLSKSYHMTKLINVLKKLVKLQGYLTKHYHMKNLKAFEEINKNENSFFLTEGENTKYIKN